MIYINGEAKTRISAYGGQLIQGWVAAPDIIGTPRPTITGNIIEPVVQNFDAFSGFDFAFTINPTATTQFTVTFTYTNYDKQVVNETLEVEIMMKREDGKILFSNNSDRLVTDNISATGATYSLPITTKNIVSSINVSSDNMWLSGQMNGSNLVVNVNKSTNTIPRSGELVLSAIDDSGNRIYARNIVTQVAAQEYEQSQFSLSEDNITVTYDYSGAHIINVIKDNITSYTVKSNDDFYNFEYDDTRIAIAHFQNNTTPFAKQGLLNVTAEGSDGKLYKVAVKIIQNPNPEAGSLTLPFGYSYKVPPYANQTAQVQMSLVNIFAETLQLSYDEMYDNYLDIRLFDNAYIITTKFSNETYATKTYNFTITGQDYAGNQISVDFVFEQLAETLRTEFPIWKTEVVNFATPNDYVDYQLIREDTQEILYNARAYAIDGNVQIEVNSIVKQYLQEQINIDIDGWQSNNGYVLVRLVIDGNDYRIYGIYNDWSYQDNDNKIISYPVDTLLDYRQRFFVSAINRMNDTDEYTRIEVDVDGGSVDNPEVIDNQIETKSILDLNDVFEIVVKTLDSQKQEMLKYKVDCTNSRYCLYYLNKFGGYDSMLFLPASMQSDTVVNREFNRLTYDVHKHSLTQYEKELTEQWQLKTKYLTDEQSKRMQHLLTSTQIWLQDLETGDIVPVVITDTNIQHKLRINQSKKKYQYIINVKSSKNKYRR